MIKYNELAINKLVSNITVLNDNSFCFDLKYLMNDDDFWKYIEFSKLSESLNLVLLHLINKESAENTLHYEEENHKDLFLNSYFNLIDDLVFSEYLDSWTYETDLNEIADIIFCNDLKLECLTVKSKLFDMMIGKKVTVRFKNNDDLVSLLNDREKRIL